MTGDERKGEERKEEESGVRKYELFLKFKICLFYIRLGLILYAPILLSIK